MINFLLLMIVPCLIALGYVVYRNRNGYGLPELARDAGIQIGLAAIIVAIGVGIAYYQGTSDTEILDGQITAKKRNEVSCSHSYKCNCYYTTDSKGNTTEHCSTCYEHDFDVDWDIYSSIPRHNLSIDRIDSQGLQMPPRWGVAYVGEPFSAEHSFDNYIKANPQSVLLGTKGNMEKFGKMIPDYPQVYDYYNVHHFYNMGVQAKNWDYLLAMANRSLGPQKQVNLIVVLVPTDDSNYVYAFKDKWLGGKKNDAIILIGSANGHDIDWVDVVSWTTNKEYPVYIRDRIMAIKYLDHNDEIIKVITEETENRFVRMHMKDMEYLMRSFQPSGTAMFVILILGILASVGGIFISEQLHKQERW